MDRRKKHDRQNRANRRTRYTRQAIITSAFLQIPRFLYTGEFAGNRISNNARSLYSLILDRHKISIKNAWHDESGSSGGEIPYSQILTRKPNKNIVLFALHCYNMTNQAKGGQTCRALFQTMW